MPLICFIIQSIESVLRFLQISTSHSVLILICNNSTHVSTLLHSAPSLLPMSQVLLRFPRNALNAEIEMGEIRYIAALGCFNTIETLTNSFDDAHHDLFECAADNFLG